MKTDQALLRGVHTNMMGRCYKTTYTGYSRYGGRGITVCEEWHNFDTFLKWAKDTYWDTNLTIDRIHSFGHYNPNNCRWISRSHNSSRATKTMTRHEEYLGVFYRDNKDSSGHYYRITKGYQTIIKGPYNTAYSAAQARDCYITNKRWHNTLSLSNTTVRRPDLTISEDKQTLMKQCYKHNISRKETAQQLKISQPTVGRYYAMFADLNCPRITVETLMEAA